MENKLYNEILKNIRENGEIYFSEIETIFENNDFEYEGDKAIYNGENISLLIWNGWNKQAINIILELMKHKNIYARPLNNYIELLLQGRSFELPLAKKQHHVYKQAHWLPSKLIWVN